jgi:hypothetical protein
MAREKDSIQRLLDKGKTRDEIIAAGKYTAEEVDNYLNSEEIDSSQNDEPTVAENVSTVTNPNEPYQPNENELEAAIETRPEDVEEVIDAKTNNIFSGKTKSETERDYTKGSSKKPVMEVQEVFERPDHTQPLDDDPLSASGTTTNPAGQPAPANPKLAGASPDQKRIAAEKLFDVVVAPIYEQASVFLPLLAKLSDKKVRRMVLKDEIDPNMPMMWQDENGQIQSQTLQELIHEHNKQCDIAIGYNEKFITDIREPSIREFIKRGWGIAEEDEFKFQLIMEGVRILAQTAVLTGKKYEFLSEAKLSYAENKKANGGKPDIPKTPVAPYVPPVNESMHGQNPHHNPFPKQEEKPNNAIEDAVIVDEIPRESEEQ